MMNDKYAALLTGRDHDDVDEGGLGFQSAIFGSVGRMSSAIQQQDETRRIAIYPCIGAGEAGTGLLLVLASLLASSEDVELYPVLLRVLEDETLSETPFTPDEWVLDDLDDDTAIWGNLSQIGEGWTLKVFVEDDASEGDLLTFETSATDWSGLFAGLPKLATEIADKLGLQFRLPLPSEGTPSDSTHVQAFCAVVFTFYKELLKTILMSSENATLPTYSSLCEAAKHVESILATWGAAVALSYLSRLVERFSFAETLAYSEYPTSLAYWEDGVAIFSLSVMDDEDASSDLKTWCLEQLEAVISQYPTHDEVWITLALFYTQLKRPDLAIDVCQRALEADVDTDVVYFAYADALNAAAEDGFKIARLMFGEDIAVSEEAIRHENLISLERGIAIKPNTSRLAQYVVEAAKHQKLDEAQQIFGRLTELSQDGQFVDTVIQQLSYLDDVEWMISPLQKAAEQGGFLPLLNLARAALLVEDEQMSKKAAEKALATATESYQSAEAQMLLLELEVPALQADLADIVARLQQKGGEVYERDLEFMEYLVENAPDYTEGYLALSSAYRVMDEPNTALEVLLDAEKVTKGTPELYLALAELLEREDELTLAIENVRKGLDLAPVSVPLLAQAALLAYLSGDEEGAQAFLRRAHAISPYHSRIVAVTRRIQNKNDDDDDQ